MNYKLEKLPKSKILLTITLDGEELKKYNNKAIAHFAEHIEVKGFRAGKAPKELVSQQVGQNRINSEASNIAIEDSYGQVVVDNDIDVAGYPKIDLVKFIPNQELEYKAEVAVFPEVKLADYKEIAKIAGKSDRQEVKIEDEEMEKALNWLADSRGKYGEDGKIIERPEINDEFAKLLGNFENLDALKKNIKEGMLSEKEQAEKERFKIALISKIAKESEMDLPDIMVESEIDKMVHELQHDVEHRGMQFDNYLEHIKKTKEDLKKEFQDKAIERVRIAMAMREINKAENIKVSDEELTTKITDILMKFDAMPTGRQGKKEDIDPAPFAGNKEYALRVASERCGVDQDRLHGYANNVLTNEKVFELLEKFSSEN